MKFCNCRRILDIYSQGLLNGHELYLDKAKTKEFY